MNIKQREIKQDDNVYEILNSVNELLEEKNLKIIFDDGKEKDGYGIISLKDEMTKREKVGIGMADSLMSWLHMMYQKDTARGVLLALIKRLQERVPEFDRKGEQLKWKQKSNLKV